MHKLLILLSCFFILVASKCENGKGEAKCTEMGTIKDFSGMDGCGMMIVLDSGEKLQPIEYDSDKPEIRDGQRIKFAYKEAKDQMGICMSGKMVKVTCIEFIGSPTGGTRPSGTGGIKPIKKECVETIDPYSTEWLQGALNRTNAYQVIRYTYRTDGFAYYFLGPKNNLMLDCQGTIICECGSRDTKCDDQAKNYLDELVIFEKD